jgi:hypothetical protein
VLLTPVTSTKRLVLWESYLFGWQGKLHDLGRSLLLVVVLLWWWLVLLSVMLVVVVVVGGGGGFGGGGGVVIDGWMDGWRERDGAYYSSDTRPTEPNLNTIIPPDHATQTPSRYQLDNIANSVAVGEGRRHVSGGGRAGDGFHGE